jgi:hypothetical protein
LLTIGHPRTTGLDKVDIHTYSAKIIANEEASEVFQHYPVLIAKPFLGITTNGQKVPDLYKIQDEGAPVEGMVLWRLGVSIDCRQTLPKQLLLVSTNMKRAK